MTDPKTAAASAVKASLAADSLSLCAHWIYDAKAIRDRFGRVDTLMDPAPGSHHKNRRAGQFTHYGDQTVVLLESLTESQGFDPADFFRRWKLLFSDYDGYMDGATKQTLQRMDMGHGPSDCGSTSNDLAGASRMAPLLLCPGPDGRGLDEDGLVRAARDQTRMTHNNPRILDATEFFARSAWAVLHGQGPVAAMRRAAQADYNTLPASDWLEQGLEFSATDTVTAVNHFGQSCHVDGAMRSVVQIVARYEDDPAEGLVANVMAGGDSAARGLLAGMLLGAAADSEALPSSWWTALTRRADLEEYMRRMG